MPVPTNATLPVSAAEAPAFAEATVSADGFDIRYLDAGRGDPLLVLHGGGGLPLNPSHDLLAEHARLIAVEVPGFGEVANERTTSLHDLATTILQLADALALDRFSMVGTSFGAALGSWVASEEPERVDKLVLISPGISLHSATGSGLLVPRTETPKICSGQSQQRLLA
jgi:pimeloyl-ACP methyl ester carboxylesterase